jgi:hypothetical protein
MRRLGPCLLAVLAALVTVAAAGAHGRHGIADGYIATFSGVTPNVPGVFVNVFGPENLFRVSNYSGKEIVVLGARGEPYLRFTPTAVFENTAAPTAYLNASRPVPSTAANDAEPRWRKVGAGPSHTWHEHRVVWSKSEDPEVVRESPHEPHLIFRWAIPATADGKPFRIKGFLGWSPPRTGESGDDNGPLVAGVAVGAALALVAIAATLWRRARRPAESGGGGP